MIKKFGIALSLALLLLLSLGTAAFADDPDVVITTWDGSGTVAVTVDTGDAQAGVITTGDAIVGSYTVTETPNTSYPYMGVDSFSGYLNASVVNGYIDSGSLRTDSYGGYGAPGQNSWSYVEVVGGSASMAYRTTTNYAALGDFGYTYQLPGGHNIVVDADSYLMNRQIVASDGTFSLLHADGSGTATLDCMVSEASATGVRLGWGGGCYTDANFSATGAGQFALSATGDTSVTTAMVPGMAGATSFSIVANWLSSFSVADYSVTAN